MCGSRVGNELPDIDFRVLCLIAINSIFHLATECTDKALYRPCCRVPESTDSVTFNLERKFLKHVDLSEIRIAFLYTSKQIDHPAGPLAAGRALPAALMFVKLS
jgi:hypothetical protein